jgi:hypothetical protein
VSQGSVLSPTLYIIYIYIHINDTSQTPGVYPGLFAVDTCIYSTDRKEVYVLRKLQRGLSAIETWCERWNIKINETKTQAVYFSRRLRPPEARLLFSGQNIHFVNHVKYLGVIFDKRITWRLRIEIIEAKAFRTFIRIYSVFRSECLSANIKLTHYKALIRSIMTYACFAWELEAYTSLLKLVHRTIANFPRCTPVRYLYTALNLPYVYRYTTKSYKVMRMNMFAV